MSHVPFIVAAYSMAVVLMGWCAFAPVLQARKLKRFINSRIDHTEDNHASDT